MPTDMKSKRIPRILGNIFTYHFDYFTYTFHVHPEVFSFGKQIIWTFLLNSSSPVDIVNEGGGEMKSNEEEGDCSKGQGDGIQADEGSSDSDSLDADKLYKSWENYKDGHKLER